MTIATYRDAFAAFSNNGGGAGPAWLPALRRRAFDTFTALGFPSTRDEDWHYTSVAPIAEKQFTLAPAGGAAKFSAGTVHRAGDNTLVFMNGRFSRDASSFASLPAEVEIATLSAMVSSDPDFVQANLASLASFERSAFTALNTAFAADGVVVRIPADVVVDEPLHIFWVADSSANGAMLSPRLLVDVGANSRLTIVQYFSGVDGTPYFTNAVSEVRVGDGARVEFCNVQQESTDAFHVSTVQAIQGRDASLHAFSFAAGARLSRANVYTTLSQPGGEARLNGLYLLRGRQHCDHQTFVHHAAESCASRELYKGILDDESHGVFNGKVLVDPIAQKTDGKQTNHALLLSERAKVDTKPQLEIFADDVKCTHGATVGRLDEHTQFYLKSRGLSREAARALLTYAFAAEVLGTLEVEPVRESLQTLAFERYNARES
ncbi:MAG TPA: Fe-S cluster assembly protein SufD [Gemmatimonadaceae bacterium]|nr:Fe-S cluster assembly protein SufD [Gemmatimonadaceae bacterium]